MATAKKVENGKVRYAVVAADWISQTALLPGVEHTGNSAETTIQDLDDFRIVSELGSLYSDPPYAMPGGMKHVVTIDEDESSESFSKTDQFGGELKYFSDCVINGTDPEPDW